MKNEVWIRYFLQVSEDILRENEMETFATRAYNRLVIQ